jgi:hypothetical protein
MSGADNGRAPAMIGALRRRSPPWASLFFGGGRYAPTTENKVDGSDLAIAENGEGVVTLSVRALTQRL